MSQAHSTSQSSAYHRSLAEWITFAIASAVVLAVVSMVIYDWTTSSTAPPMLTVVQQGNIERMNDQFQVAFTISNAGGQTAEAVQIVAELRQNSELIEEGEQQVDFLSGGEEEEGAFLFSQDPAQAELSIRVASYKLP